MIIELVLIKLHRGSQRGWEVLELACADPGDQLDNQERWRGGTTGWGGGLEGDITTPGPPLSHWLFGSKTLVKKETRFIHQLFRKVLIQSNEQKSQQHTNTIWEDVVLVCHSFSALVKQDRSVSLFQSNQKYFMPPIRHSFQVLKSLIHQQLKNTSSTTAFPLASLSSVLCDLVTPPSPALASNSLTNYQIICPGMFCNYRHWACAVLIMTRCN